MGSLPEYDTPILPRPPLRPNIPYAVVKSCAEHLVEGRTYVRTRYTHPVREQLRTAPVSEKLIPWRYPTDA